MIVGNKESFDYRSKDLQLFTITYYNGPAYRLRGTEFDNLLPTTTLCAAIDFTLSGNAFVEWRCNGAKGRRAFR